MRLHLCARGFAVSALVLGVLSAPAAAQTGLPRGAGLEQLPRIGLGYVTNAPTILTGMSAWGVVDVMGGLGLYVDGKLNLNTPADASDFAADLTVSEVEATPNQQLMSDESGWWSVNAALIRPLSPELMIYLGAGYAYRDQFRRYYDPEETLVQDTFGWYWVRDETASGGSLNLLGGAFFRIGSRLALQFGYETTPSGGTVGVSYSLPLR